MQTWQLTSTPVFRVALRNQENTIYWSKAEPDTSPLKALIPGETYWLIADAECSVGEGANLVYLQTYVWQKVTWPWPAPTRCNQVKITPGQKFTEAGLRDIGLNIIEQLGLAPIFNRAKLNEIRILDEAGFASWGYNPRGVGGILQADRVLLLRDEPSQWLPEGVLAATILHECWHLIVLDIVGDPSGWCEGINKNELMAYTVSQIVHWLKGEEVDVFKDAPGSLYPAAVKLLKLPWPGQI